MKSRLAGLAAALTVIAWSLAATAQTRPCGEGAPCAAGAGTYYLAFPDDWDGKAALPAIIFFHGHRSSGLSVIRSASLRSSFARRGYLVIAPNGQPRGRDNVLGWPARPFTGEGRDDLAFVMSVVDDVARRIPLQRERILVSGFSSGGSMAWLVACYEGSHFAAFVALSGTLRQPVPATGDCPGGPARMLHFHGFADSQVPLEGRGIRDWHQGDVFEALTILRTTNRCASKPSRIDVDVPFGCRVWRGCESGKDIELCIHGGGHEMPKGWADRARAWFEGTNGPS